MRNDTMLLVLTFLLMLSDYTYVQLQAVCPSNIKLTASLQKLMKEFYSILTGEIEPPEEDDHPQSQQQHHQAPVRSHHANPNPPPPIVSSETVNAPAYVPVPEPLPEDETPTAAQTQAAIDAAAAFAKRGPTLKPWLTKKLGELRALKDSS